MNEKDDDWKIVGEFYRELSSKEKAWEDEAQKLFLALDDADLIQAETYLQKNPPSAGAMAFLLLVARDKFKSERAKDAARASHQETYLMKIEIIERYKNEKSTFKSKNEAAIAFDKIYPLKLETIRNYLKNL